MWTRFGTCIVKHIIYCKYINSETGAVNNNTYYKYTVLEACLIQLGTVLLHKLLFTIQFVGGFTVVLHCQEGKCLNYFPEYWF